MRVIKIKFEDIKFKYTEYDESLKQSLLERNIALSLKVKQIDGGYECIDGNKRLSCIYDLKCSHEDFQKFDYINCLISNDFTKQGSSYWGAMNHH